MQSLSVAEYSSDIENYGGKGLTSYANVRQRFTALRVNLWTHKITDSGSGISARVPPHGVAFYRIRPIR